MVLTLFATSLRGRKAYKDVKGMVYLECTVCYSIKIEDSFQKEKTGFLGRRFNCCNCRNEQNRQYREKRALA
ncbi:hypothetical protein FA727_01055 [Robertmurraya kyonggiensis]|uniref:Uncharacterized protein n=1 Tax=Robertmurraya kyonggiensis TaxID=1037680 RepID=A0A4U1D6E9_9BACI|nr:hypothetical protein FA727_01055 [Robertmurraya kyonggiensis]